MPFMIGAAPIRRTVKYLRKGTIVFRENVRIFSVNYNHKLQHHEGAREFIFWHLAQIQYKNPEVQCLTFRDLTPSPFIRVFLEGGENILIDVDSRSKIEILKHLENFTAICKDRSEIKEIKRKLSKNENPTQYFGYGCHKHCICEIIGQVPCTSLVSLPKMWKNFEKYQPVFKIPPNYMEPDLLEKTEEEEEE